MNFESIYSNHESAEGVSHCVKHSIENAPWPDSGQLETLTARVEKLVEIVALIAAQLPEKGQIALAYAIGFVVAEELPAVDTPAQPAVEPASLSDGAADDDLV